MSQDPLGVYGRTTNLYSYAANNPALEVDPLGLSQGVVQVRMLRPNSGTWIWVSTKSIQSEPSTACNADDEGKQGLASVILTLSEFNWVGQVLSNGNPDSPGVLTTGIQLWHLYKHNSGGGTPNNTPATTRKLPLPMSASRRFTNYANQQWPQWRTTYCGPPRSEQYYRPCRLWRFGFYRSEPRVAIYD